MNQAILVNTLEKFLQHWNFLSEGFAILTNPKAGGQTKLSPKDYQRILLCSAVDDTVGGILLLQSRRGINLGFVCVVNDSTFLSPETATIFTIYSNEKCASTMEELSYEAQMWAKRRKFTKLTFNVHRITGAAKTFVEKKLQLEPSNLQFKKLL